MLKLKEIKKRIKEINAEIDTMDKEMENGQFYNIDMWNEEREIKEKILTQLGKDKWDAIAKNIGENKAFYKK